MSSNYFFQNLSYNEALRLSGLERLSTRRERFVLTLFKEMKHPSHILNSLLTLKDVNTDRPQTRDSFPYVLPLAMTARLARSFIPYCVRLRF